jgi:hypothetical protein
MRGWKFLAGACVIAAVAGVLPARADGATATKSVIVIGDSLTWESAPRIRSGLGAAWTTNVSAIGGMPACGMIPLLQSTLVANPHPTVIAIETAGNALAPCMGGAIPGDDAFWARYRADLATLAATASATGAHVVFVAPPPTEEPSLSAIEAQIGAIARATPGWTVTTAASVAVTPAGTFTAFLPCLKNETAKQGCVGGQIRVRNADGLHLCPVSFATTGTKPCAVYSSGERRWAAAVVKAIKSAAR